MLLSCDITTPLNPTYNTNSELSNQFSLDTGGDRREASVAPQFSFGRRSEL